MYFCGADKFNAASPTANAVELMIPAVDNVASYTGEPEA